MVLGNNTEVSFQKNADDDIEDPTAPFNELSSFDSIWQALRWTEIRTRVPICFRKTLRSRYMLANIVYLGYTIGILIIDFNPSVNGSSSYGTTDISDNSTTPSISILDQPVVAVPLVNRLYIGILA
jgi:hypothetical protein